MLWSVWVLRTRNIPPLTCSTVTLRDVPPSLYTRTWLSTQCTSIWGQKVRNYSIKSGNNINNKWTRHVPVLHSTKSMMLGGIKGASYQYLQRLLKIWYNTFILFSLQRQCCTSFQKNSPVRCCRPTEQQQARGSASVRGTLQLQPPPWAKHPQSVTRTASHVKISLSHNTIEPLQWPTSEHASEHVQTQKGR